MAHVIKRLFRSLWCWQEKERRKLLDEILKINGLMALLMKPRNGMPWTQEDRTMILVQLRSLRNLGFYITIFIAPGGILFLPLLSWWLDRRKHKREQKNNQTQR